MGSAKLLFGLMVLGFFHNVCEAQGFWSPSINSSMQSGPWKPVAPEVPLTARPAFGRHSFTQAPTRPTAGKPQFTQAPVTARPTAVRPQFTQAPTRPTVGRPQFTQAPVTARPTAVRPQFTQAPTRPTVGRPQFTQAPVTSHPTLGKPKVPTIPVEPPTPKPDAVKVYCGERTVQLEVDMDLLGIGQLIQASDITLGGCGPVGQDGSNQVLVFETELHGCGSVLAMTEDSLVYTFTLNHDPRPIGSTPIIRTSGAMVGIQCHYLRLHNVSSNALNPTWIPYYSTLSADDLLVFSLRIMDVNWQMERASHIFFLGDLINIEASVVQANHVPLRVFVETCVATLDPDMNAVARYAFIENRGCLVDSKLTSSRSQFLPRVQDDKLQFQLDAFRFAQEARSTFYIFCHLRATAAMLDSDGKACSFPLGKERWLEASGNDAACSCCDGSCGGRKGRSVDSDVQYEGNAALGPILVQEAKETALESHMPLKTSLGADGASEAVLAAGVMAAVGLVCIVLGAVLLRQQCKPSLQ